MSAIEGIEGKILSAEEYQAYRAEWRRCGYVWGDLPDVAATLDTAIARVAELEATLEAKQEALEYANADREELKESSSLMSQRDTALARVAELEATVTALSGARERRAIIDSETIATLTTERDEAMAKLGAVSAEYRELESDRDNLRGQLRAVNVGIDGVWRYQGDGYDKLETLSCPVVMRPDTLKAILNERDDARRIAGIGALANDNDWQEKYAVISDKCVAARAVLSALVASLANIPEYPRAVPLRNAIALLAGQTVEQNEKKEKSDV